MPTPRPRPRLEVQLARAFGAAGPVPRFVRACSDAALQARPGAARLRSRVQSTVRRTRQRPVEVEGPFEVFAGPSRRRPLVWAYTVTERAVNYTLTAVLTLSAQGEVTQRTLVSD